MRVCSPLVLYRRDGLRSEETITYERPVRVPSVILSKRMRDLDRDFHIYLLLYICFFPIPPCGRVDKERHLARSLAGWMKWKERLVLLSKHDNLGVYER